MDSEQNMLIVALELLIVAVILYALVKGVIPMAAALAGGLTMGVMTARSLSGGVRQTANLPVTADFAAIFSKASTAQ